MEQISWEIWQRLLSLSFSPYFVSPRLRIASPALLEKCLSSSAFAWLDTRKSLKPLWRREDTAKNAADWLRVVYFCRLVATCWQVVTSLSISSSCNKPVKIRLVGICHWQTWYNSFKQLAASLLITSLGSQLVTWLSTTCNRLVVKSCRKPCERLGDLYRKVPPHNRCVFCGLDKEMADYINSSYIRLFCMALYC